MPSKLNPSHFFFITKGEYNNNKKLFSFVPFSMIINLLKNSVSDTIEKYFMTFWHKNLLNVLVYYQAKRIFSQHIWMLNGIDNWEGWMTCFDTWKSVMIQIYADNIYCLDEWNSFGFGKLILSVLMCHIFLCELFGNHLCGF